MSKKFININCIYYEGYSKCIHPDNEKKFLFLTINPKCVYIKDKKSTCFIQKRFGRTYYD